MSQTYYDILNLKPAATDEQIKDAYRHLVHLYHPDVSTDPNAGAKIIEINRAYATLKDTKKRKYYDQQQGFNQTNNGKEALHDQTFEQWQSRSTSYENSPLFGSDSFSFDAVFSAYGRDQAKQTPSGFNSYDDVNKYSNNASFDPTKGADKTLQIEVKLATAYTGSKYLLKLNVPTHQPNGQMLDETVQLHINIPKGVVNGQKICLPNYGSASPVGGDNGDLYLQITLQPPNGIQLDKKDVYQTVSIYPWQALFGDTAKVSTPAGFIDIQIPPNSQTGSKLRMVGKGIPSKSAQAAGDLYLTVHIINPTNLTAEQRKLYALLESSYQ